MRSPESANNLESRPEVKDFNPDIKSFKTDHGSVYEKLPDGTFRRHKYDGTEHDPLEWTLFIDEGEDGKDLEFVLQKIRMNNWQKKRGESASVKQIAFVVGEFDDVNDDVYKNLLVHKDEITVEKPNHFRLLAVEVDDAGEPEVIMEIPTTLRPKVGYGVFEFDDTGYHLGDLVSEVERDE